MDIFVTMLLGFAVGLIAKLLMPGGDPGGFVVTLLLGIAGAFVAKYIGQALGWYGETEPAGFLASIAGAILLLLLYRMAFRRSLRP